jgi:hypothetical protein
MKLTRERLKQIIKEELKEISSPKPLYEADAAATRDLAFKLVQSLEAQLEGKTWENLSIDTKINLMQNAISNFEMQKYQPGEPVQERKKR